ncbi:MAG: hypothetical protein PWP23_1531 [Candidatus Sumerlaeota bacterium]|nr:hypothetical protein [Candidatus Sumerlaeota bacterium]
MYSVKRGRGPSAGAAIGGIVAALFGVFWTVMATKMGAPGFFVLFGIAFVLMGLASAVYNAYNATSGNRFSEYDITTSEEERDPLTPRRGHDRQVDGIQFRGTGPVKKEGSRRYQGDYCPFCGQKVERNFDYCPGCGRDI